MVGTNPLAQEAFWANKAECDDAEKKYYQNLYGKVRQQIFQIFEKCETNTATKPSYNPRFLTFYTSRVFRCFVGTMILFETLFPDNTFKLYGIGVHRFFLIADI